MVGKYLLDDYYLVHELHLSYFASSIEQNIFHESGKIPFLARLCRLIVLSSEYWKFRKRLLISISGRYCLVLGLKICNILSVS